MTVTVRRFQVVHGVALNQQVNLYTVPAGKRAIVRSLFQGYDGGVVDASMGVTLNGAGFIWDQKVSQWDSRIWPLSTVLYSGQSLSAQHTQPGQYTMLQVAEMDETLEGANLWQGHLTNVSSTTTRTFVVPAGKRVRVREVVICNHGDAQGWNVYIGGVGHFVKLQSQPRVGNVIGVDLTANAGETVGAANNGPNGHVFLSGVIEDA